MSKRIVSGLLFALIALVSLPATARPDPAVDRLIEHGHWQRARAALTPMLQAHPDDPALLCAMARVKQAFGELDPALALAERAVKATPGDAGTHAVLAEICGQKAQRAGALQQFGLARRFKKEAEAAIAIDPQQIEIQLDLISFYVQAPGVVGGDKKKARELADEIARRDPAAAWRARERFATETGDTSSLGAIYRDAVAKQPDDYRARLALAGWLFAPWRGSAADVEAQARAAIALEPERVGGYTMLAVVLARGARWDDLDRVLAEAEAKVPDDLTPVYQSARLCLTEAHDPARAERLFRHYLTRPAEAGGAPHAAAHWRLGLALEQQGRAPEARAEIETATRLDPKFEPAKQDLKRIRG